MTSGEIFVAFVDGAHVIRLKGDVRLNLCSALEKYLDDILTKPDFSNIVVDLSEAIGVDSTTLGQIAKISILCRDRFHLTPTIVSPNPNITKILLSMGFDQVFHIIDETLPDDADFTQWAATAVDEDEARQQVIDAHKVLMGMNEKNKDTFKELVDCLEADLHKHS
ncbi:STAS domain-containing protein [Bacterioplanoides sp.]|uniref:STAS domain-containing protein n=1 Tax=Bacterioplanoides sp. TaxID=2066072 RepID=UPI003B00A0A6